MNKKIFLIVFCFFVIEVTFSQEVGEYGFLQLPVSAHSGALGGSAISIVEPEAALADQNPSLLCPQMVGQASFSFMKYLSGTNLGYASYTGNFYQEGAWQAGIRFVDYGHFDGYDEDGSATGSFGAKDIAFQVGVGYPINESWHIGGTLRAIYSKYESCSAFAMGVDIGLNYYDEGIGRSFSVVLSNVGGQLKSLENRRCNLPTQLSIGVSKEVEHLPFCFTMTAIDLFDWHQEYINRMGEKHKYKNAEHVLNHLLLGIEWIPTENFYLASAYSYRRQREFSGDGGFLRGLSLGTGLKWGVTDIQCSYSSYNAEDGSLQFSFAYKF